VSGHPELLLAAQHDAACDHAEAINALARGTSAGDRDCTRHLGLRLLLGDRAPLMPAQGLQFLGEALEKGDGEAGARAAAILGFGGNIPANWRLALDWLRRSAVAGWAPAQQQLLALCEDRNLATRAEVARKPDWHQVASAVDLAVWRRAPDVQIQHADPRVSTFRNLLRPELCRFFISLAPGRLQPAKVYDPVRREDTVDVHRNNTQAVFGLPIAEFAHVLLQARMAAACGVSERHMEAPAVLHYSPGEEIVNHFDFVDPKTTPDYSGEITRNGQRLITFLLYLNDDYDGGETDFPHLKITWKGRTGEGIYFVNALADLSPDLRMMHAGRPTTRGEKWLITQFVRSRPTR
jgi:hypothetical protein